MRVPPGNRPAVPRDWSRGIPERYVAGADTRGRQEGRPYPWSQQVIHEISGLGESTWQQKFSCKQVYGEANVDIKTLLTTFSLIFLAELGDKTQFAALCLSADSKSPLAVFLGASLALVISSLLAVLLGAFLARCFPPYVIKTVAGILFIVMGVIMLVTR
jgi:putative Ca2+/H+ antiporter (TMEM165/GDT1 family)